ncbi:SpvB/TcaC N-terminal domain-containing protein [Pantanalinema rosaneae CENA516]|uniref:SpvB/TcaC N-terminal domain-containing protein n=1 Tax=Pantanalinema rosaneae TaxID=1620701 RepID=UPI003D6F11BF
MLSSSAKADDNQSANGKNGYVAPPPAVSLPKGGGAIQGIGETFDINPVTGTGSLSIPIAVSPGRAGFAPQISLSYDSSSGNGAFGLGWNLGVPSITRKTQKGLPQYGDAKDSDIFLLSGAEDLVPALLQQGSAWVRDTQPILVPEQVLDSDLPPSRIESVLASYPHLGTYTVQRYQPRIEGLFARIERWQHQETGDVHWRSVTKDNITSVYGKTLENRVVDPLKPFRVFEWLLCESYDDKGNVIIYQYKQENPDNVNPALIQEKNRLANGHSYTNKYLKKIFYGNQNPYQRNNWLFGVVFDYGEHGTNDPRLDDSTLEELPLEERLASDNPTPNEDQTWLHRPDAFSTFRSGFEIRTQRLCRRVLMFHQFEELGANWTLVRSTDFRYDKDPVATYLVSATQMGYVRDAPTEPYRRRSLPPLQLTYDRPQINETIQTMDAESLKNLPIGLDDAIYQWLDLDGEGISGILTEQAEGWFYKANLGEAQFAPVQLVATKPSVSNLQDSQQRLMDLAGDGQQDLVLLSKGLTGFYERGHQQNWTSFKPFKSIPNLDWNDPNLRWIDLNGDGHADILISEHEVFVWYPSKAEEGFGDSSIARKLRDEEQGAALVFADGTQSIYLADMDGDGLNDIVRIRNSEVCYWSNMGYGRFGAKVTMGKPPYFDHPELFEQRRIRLADIDGSGATDIIYLGREAVSLWFNQAGNSWGEPHRLRNFPRVDNLASVQTVDLLGNGTACLVWSSPLPGAFHQRMQYIDLMGGQKPHLLRMIQNNLGAETWLQYAASTKFYLEDKQAGTPWITKIPFPVHVVERVETIDHLSGNRFVTSYRYRHGYFDGEEREFRGFGYVEQLDTESFAAFQSEGATNATDAAFHVPPVRTKTWFHTGFYRDRNHISQLFTEEYYREPRHRIPPNATEAERAEIEARFQASLLPDTHLPTGLTAQEEHEACRALKGSLLRQEVYALDESNQSEHPYSVSEQDYQIRRLQPKQDRQYAVFFVHPSEAISYAYDRNPDDPRVGHQLTLEVDEFGTVKKSAAVAYPRRSDALPEHPRVREAQSQTYITYTEVDVIHRPESEMFYRIGVPAETRVYEITVSTAEDERFSLDELREAIQAATEISYEVQPASEVVQKRLVKRDRILYYRNDLSGALPLGAVESLALPFEAHRLAFTPGLLERVYGDRVNDTMLSEEGRYIQQDGLWWMPSGHTIFDPDHFYLPIQTIDPFGQTYTTTYDNYDLLTVQTEDPLNNVVTVDNDYRVLQPRQLTDPNGNRAQVLFDALGMVVATAVMGKADENQGDLLDGTVRADLLPQEIEAFAADPLGMAASLLGNATTRIIYDLERFRTSSEPVFGATLVRETHVSDPLPPDGLKIQVSFGYSDGFGRAIQTKIQAEPGSLDLSDPNAPVVDPHWVGTGWTIFNNKGKPVKQYEPFFSATHEFEFAKQVGVSPTLFYDPIQRVMATLHPNHTYEKVVFDPWQQTTWDVNDTVLLNPAEDEDVGSFFNGLDESEYLPTWHEQRIGGGRGVEEQRAAQRTEAHAETRSTVHLDTLGRPILTVAHNRFEENDTLVDEFPETRVGLDIEGNSLYVEDARGNLVMVNAMVTRDEQGQPLRDSNGNPLLEATAYNLLSHSLYSLSSDAGERWTLNNVAGNPIRGWNSRGFETRLLYDELQRPTHLFVRESPDTSERLVERTVYGEKVANAVALNLRGKPFMSFDSAGIVINAGQNPATNTEEAYDFKGNSLRSRRQIAREYKQQMDWATIESQLPVEPTDVLDREAIAQAITPLVEENFTVSTVYDALNRPISVIAPDGSEARPTYNEANLLEQMSVRLRGTGEFVPFVTNIDYNEKGQRTLIEYDNGVRTEYFYERETFRLTNLRTTRVGENGNSSLQNLHYTYDPVGNITSIRDEAQQTIFFNGEVVSPSNDYIYDAIYQLRQATGREHVGQTTNDPQENRPELKPHYDFNDSTRRNLPHPHDGQAMRTYTEQYRYDAVGNILAMIHAANGGTWTRNYEYAEENNRLLRTSLPQEQWGNYGYDDHGNMTEMPHLPLMEWDFKDQLQASSKQVRTDGGTPEITYYVYDAGGQRVRKVTERQADPGVEPTRMKERIYLGGFEIYREYSGDGSTVTLERETLHVMDDQQRIAVVETKAIDVGDGINPPTDLLTPIRRYQLSNHLGSASLELDAGGAVISYEEYHPYGTTAYQAGRSIAEVSLKRYRYTGKERDEETGLYYHGARYYAPWLGRWTAVDPANMIDGVNLYRYTRNNPVTLIDPSGTNSEITVHSDPDLAYRAALGQYQKSSTQVDLANRDFQSSRENYSPEVQADIEDNIRYAQQQLRQEYRDLLRFRNNLPQLRKEYKFAQAQAAQKAEEINQIRQKFRNAEGFVNRFALFVGTSLLGVWAAAGVGGGAVVSSGVSGGIGGGTYSGGEELIRQSEADEDLDLLRAAEEGGEGAVYGTLLGGIFGKLSQVVPRIPGYLRRIPKEAGLTETNQLRGIAAETGQTLKSTRNVATGRANIEGVKSSANAVSGQKQPNLPNNVNAPKSRALPPANSKSRPVDSERLILEHFARIIPKSVGGSRVRGTITIFSERVPCSACQEAATAFEELFEGTVKVFFSNGGVK